MTGIASRGQLRMSFVRTALVIVPLILLLGFLSGWLSGSSARDGWYAALVKPAYTPPGGTFAVAWTLLYVSTGTALAMIMYARGAAGRGLALGLFVGQFALSLAWSPTFFRAHAVGTAFWIIVGVLGLAAAATVLFFRIRSSAGWLMLPYLSWIAFAAQLNYDIDRLNPQAESLAPVSGSAEIAL